MIPDQYTPIYRDGGRIHIKPENRGKFTALKERTGHSASWFKENGTPAQKKMAVFALNSRKWKH
jgi:long-subunit acyl-CoA synthetase (AMP-forming)